MIEEIVQLLIPEEGNFSLQGATATCHRLFISGEQKTERTYLKSLPTLISNVTNDGKYLTKKQWQRLNRFLLKYLLLHGSDSTIFLDTFKMMIWSSKIVVYPELLCILLWTVMKFFITSLFYQIRTFAFTKCFLLRTCVFLRHPYISAAQLLEWSMRKRVTYRASPEYGLISIFHSVKNAYFITPHSQPISRNAKCSLFVPRPLHRVGLFLRE